MLPHKPGMSDPSYEAVFRLTHSESPVSQRRLALRQFAQLNGWRPSDEMDDYPGTERVANGHLVVEHGLDNSAVITFLKTDSPFASLSRSEQCALLTISYNHMVDWHLFPDREGIVVVFNRLDPLEPRRINLHENRSIWRAEAFDAIVGRKPNPNIKALDDALIDTVSHWKRLLSADIGTKLSNDSIATLFNAIMFVRALEDQRNHEEHQRSLHILDAFNSSVGGSVAEIFKICISRLGISEWPKDLLQSERLTDFDTLDRPTLSALFTDFYENRFAPYRYDFSLMSKHALSRIYEHYVSLLRTEDTRQLSFFPSLPTEERNKATGGIYTPQYLARFFGRYIKENVTPRAFRILRTCDPACGSGIFLRTLLEMQCDPLSVNPVDAAAAAFPQVSGVDVDPNACQASRLSLALLHLVLTGKLPAKLEIINEEIISFYEKHPELKSTFDVVVGNPPFVKWDNLSQPMKAQVSAFMREYSSGKVDLSLAVLRISMDLVRPGGFLLFVLPHSFLIAKNALQLRQEIPKQFYIRFLGDISDVKVFGDTGIYVVLLILQKKNVANQIPVLTTVLHCKDFVGHALEDVVLGRVHDTEFYTIFNLDQSELNPESWAITRPELLHISRKLQGFAHLDDFLNVQEGFVTGADPVFLRFSYDLPKKEKDIYVPYLADRDMERYHVPTKVSKFVFFPYRDGKLLTEEQMRSDYSETWEYLKAHATQLKKRSSVKAGHVLWWRPHRPAPVAKMLTPKLVSPHLILIPRFAFDATGKYAVSHSPWLTPIEDSVDPDILKFFVAVLNSTVAFWEISRTSHKYSRGYLMLEKKTLKSLRVPKPQDVPTATMSKLLKLVDRRLEDPSLKDCEGEIDAIVANIYGLSKQERQYVGME
jgi:type I restriction-modification system DNA methylase subunit